MARWVAGSSGGGDVTLAGAQTFTGAKTFNAPVTVTAQNGGLRSSTWFGLGAGVGSQRNPFYQNSVVNGTSFANATTSGGGDDYVGHQINVKFEGGFAHLIQTRTGSMTSGSATLTLTAGTFADPIKVGYTVFVPGAGSGGSTLKSTILAITNDTTATLAAPASTTVAGATITASLAPDPAFIFGANDYFITGSNTGDLSGITEYFGRLMEVHVFTPNATLNNVRGSVSEAYIEASATGTTVTNAIAHTISPVTNRGTATVTNAYGLLVGSPTTGTNRRAILTTGNALVQFGGSLTIANDLNSTATVFNVFAGATSADGARLNLRANSVDGYAYMVLPQSGAKFNINDGTNNVIELRNSGVILSKQIVATATTASAQAIVARQVSGQTANILAVQDFNTNDLWAVNSAGIPRWTAATNQQTTVGAAGGAAALPATPTKYLKVVDSTGATLVIPAYTA